GPSCPSRRAQRIRSCKGFWLSPTTRAYTPTYFSWACGGPDCAVAADVASRATSPAAAPAPRNGLAECLGMFVSFPAERRGSGKAGAHCRGACGRKTSSSTHTARRPVCDRAPFLEEDFPERVGACGTAAPR